MVERRWLLRLVPPVVGALVIGLAASSIGAAGGAWDPPPCPGGADRLTAALAEPAPTGPRDVARSPWFMLDGRLDGRGVLAGQALRIGPATTRSRVVSLPAESSAAGPFGRVVLVASDDGRRSRIRAIDPRAECQWTIATSRDVVRRVTVDAAGESLYEFRVDRRTRADLGIWRRPVAGGRAIRILGAPPVDPAVGITFSTTFTWSLEADRLAVQSCGAVACRTRLVDPEAGTSVLLAGPSQGELVGVGGGRAVFHEVCPGLPCALFSTDLAGGDRAVVAEGGGLARVVATEDGPRVAVERPDGRIDVRGVDGSLVRTIDPPDDGLRLVPAPDRALAGGPLPPGWIALSPDGRSPATAVLVRLADGTSVGVREVTR